MLEQVKASRDTAPFNPSYFKLEDGDGFELHVVRSRSMSRVGRKGSASVTNHL